MTPAKDRGNDWDVHLGIVCVPKRVKSPGPWGNPSHFCSQYKTRDSNNGHHSTQSKHQSDKLCWGQSVFQVANKKHQLQQPKHAKSSHVVVGSDRQEANKRNLHRHQRSQGIPGAIRGVDLIVKTAHQKQNKHVQWNDVGDKHIATPSTDHVEVEHCGQSTVENRPCVDRLHPQEKGHEQQRDGNGLVIVRAGHRSGNVHCQGGDGAKRWSQQNTDISDVDWQTHKFQDMVDDGRSHHQTGIECSSSDSS
ncbi:hypothetical protein OGATHE_001928 [Ogataea polymorpha]|uniref:Uncharacterized protein n=1 Tax=Ogataea polymorpha TaxID=460523 RepID=A0A9P8PKG8_9ASCO|nr:hypothetical protein OGATHE_001928 [Ogataea polymorpha]